MNPNRCAVLDESGFGVSSPPPWSQGSLGTQDSQAPSPRKSGRQQWAARRVSPACPSDVAAGCWSMAVGRLPSVRHACDEHKAPWPASRLRQRVGERGGGRGAMWGAQSMTQTVQGRESPSPGRGPVASSPRDWRTGKELHAE